MSKTLLILLTASTGAQAALVQSGIQDIPIPTNFTGVSVDLINFTSFNGNPAVDWSDSQVNFFVGGAGILSGPAFLPVRSGTNPSDPVIALPPGVLVTGGSTVAPIGPGGSQTHVGPGADQFESGTESYLGFRLDLTGGGDYVNGFMRVTLTNGSSPGTLHEWVYSDTPGESVTVGVIPEPATFTLTGLLGLGLLARRKRR